MPSAVVANAANPSSKKKWVAITVILLALIATIIGIIFAVSSDTEASTASSTQDGSNGSDVNSTTTEQPISPTTESPMPPVSTTTDAPVSTTTEAPVSTTTTEAPESTTETPVTPTTEAPEPLSRCAMTNYIVRDKQIFVEPLSSANNNEELTKQLNIKGVNWFGLETQSSILSGLAYGQSTLQNVAQDLRDNGINAVRLPLAVDAVLERIEGGFASRMDGFVDFVNGANPELVNVTSYIEFLKVVVSSLAEQQIAVLLDFHQLQHRGSRLHEDLWYSNDVPVSDVYTAIDNLASAFCNSEYFNVIGIDLKNEPHGTACWGSSAECPNELNWQAGASALANRMLSACPSWLAFVEGIGYPNTVEDVVNPYHNVTIGGKGPYTFSDWWGSSFQELSSSTVVSTSQEKIVYSPHYYSSSVWPQSYFFANVEDPNNNIPFDLSASGNASLKENIFAAIEIASKNAIDSGAIVIGEFGGIYGEADTDEHKTSSRGVEGIMDYIVENSLSGAFLWSLNPNSGYSFNGTHFANDASIVPFEYGLYSGNDWKEFRPDLMAQLNRIDQVPGGIEFIPCYEH